MNGARRGRAVAAVWVDGWDRVWPAVLAAVACLLLLVACGSSEPATSQKPNAPAPAAGKPAEKPAAATDKPTTADKPAAAQPAAAGPAGQQDSLVVALGSLGNESLDPVAGPSFNKQYMQLLFDSLIGADKKDEKPAKETGLAKDRQISPDGKTITFMLREGVQFSNGDELTSEDVKFSLERLGGRDVIAPFGGSIARAIDKIETPEKLRVVVTLKAPSYTFLQLLAPTINGTESMIVPKKYFESVGVEKFREAPVGTGPYKLVERKSGSHMTFEARDKHFAVGTPKYKRITIRLIPEETTRIAQLKTGQVDFADVSRENIEDLKKSNLQIFTKPSGDVLMLYF